VEINRCPEQNKQFRTVFKVDIHLKNSQKVNLSIFSSYLGVLIYLFHAKNLGIHSKLNSIYLINEISLCFLVYRNTEILMNITFQIKMNVQDEWLMIKV